MASIAEIFHSIQGEGRLAGRNAVFIRFAGCNLLCESASWRCDTIDVWRKGKLFTTGQVSKAITDFADNPMTRPLIVFTGGEPLLQSKAILEIINELRQYLVSDFELETNGTIVLPDSVSEHLVHINCSPKLENSGVHKGIRYQRDALRSLASVWQTDFKFVVSPSDLVDSLNEIKKDFTEPLNILPQRVWLMPAASTRQELIENAPAVAQACKENGYNFSPRLQLYIWDKTVGV